MDRGEEATWLLLGLLWDRSLPSSEVKLVMTACGISESTALRAARELGVVFSSHGFPRHTTWRLPER